MKKTFTLLVGLMLAITTLNGQIPFTVTYAIQAGADDAEEAVNSGAMNLTSSDLEMVREATDQIIGLRFAGINIPQGATILNAYIQFTTDETDDVATSLIIAGELTANAMTFSNTAFNISSRTTTMDSVLWENIPAWDQIGEAGPDQQTPDLTMLVEEIVNQQDWMAGNAMAFIISGSGTRNAISFNNNANAPAQLVITYEATEFPIQEFPIESGSIWRYEDSGQALDSTWTTLAYNDSTWNFGAAQLGYGDGDEATELDFGADPNNKHITYFFRKKFTVADPAIFDGLTLSLLRDDGAIVYLNGVEVLRAGLPEGMVDAQTLATDTIEGDQENAFIITELENVLQAGENVLAVEVHQVSPSSDDLSFDLSLTGDIILPPAIQLIHNSPDPGLLFVDIYVDAFQLGNYVKLNGNTPVPFRTGTPYVTDLPPGTHNIAISPFGQEDFDWNITEFTVENNKRYIAMVSGVRDTTAFETTFNSAETIAFKIQVNEVPGPEEVGAGESLPLLFHGTPDLPNIRLIAVGAGDATGDLPEGLPYGFDLVGGTVDALPYPIVQITNNESTEIYGEYKADLVPFSEQVITIYTSGFYTAEGDTGVNEPNFELMIMPPTGGFAIALPAPDPPLDGKIQIIHNSPDPELGAVDVWVNGAKLVDSLSFREATAFVDIPAGMNRVAVAPHSATMADTSWSATDIMVESDLDLTIFQPVGRTYVAVAYGARNTAAFANEVNADVSFGLLVEEAREAAVADSVTDIRVFHGSLDAPGVDALLEGQFVPIVNNLAYGSMSPIYVSLESDEGPYQLNITDQADNNAIVNSYELDLSTEAGKALIVLASGLLNAGEGQPMFGLYAVDAAGGPAKELATSPLSAQEIQQLGIEVFPNPVSDQLNILWDKKLPELRLWDVTGRLIRAFQPENNQARLDIQDFESGTYLLEFGFEQGSKSMVILKR
jgi:hypothetical protein